MPLSMLDILAWLNNGFWGLSAWSVVAYLLVTTHITIVTVTLYLHRHHRSQGILSGTTRLTSSMVMWVAFLLGAYLIIHYLY